MTHRIQDDITKKYVPFAGWNIPLYLKDLKKNKIVIKHDSDQKIHSMPATLCAAIQSTKFWKVENTICEKSVLFRQHHCHDREVHLTARFKPSHPHLDSLFHMRVEKKGNFIVVLWGIWHSHCSAATAAAATQHTNTHVSSRLMHISPPGVPNFKVHLLAAFHALAWRAYHYYIIYIRDACDKSVYWYWTRRRQTDIPGQHQQQQQQTKMKEKWWEKRKKNNNNNIRIDFTIENTVFRHFVRGKSWALSPRRQSKLCKRYNGTIAIANVLQPVPSSPIAKRNKKQTEQFRCVWVKIEHLLARALFVYCCEFAIRNSRAVYTQICAATNNTREWKKIITNLDNFLREMKENDVIQTLILIVYCECVFSLLYIHSIHSDVALCRMQISIFIVGARGAHTQSFVVPQRRG